jgi:MFS family permease
MSVWGSTAGVALLVGPIAGGLLLQAAGWEWIFFINVPVGIIGIIAVWRLVPALPTSPHRFDVAGIALSAAGLFLVVFAIQEGPRYDWGTVFGSVTVSWMIAWGGALLGVFVWWQRHNPAEPLLRLDLFADRNFSLANTAIWGMGFAATAWAIPLLLFAQKSMGLGILRSALLMVPLAVLSLLLAHPVGKLTDRLHPRNLSVFGLCAVALGTLWLGAVLSPTRPVWQIVAPLALIGLGNPFVWAPLAATAQRNLPGHLAGAGSGVYNTTRQVGAVIGAAATGMLMDSRLTSLLGGAPGDGARGGTEQIRAQAGALPPDLRADFATAMGQSLWLSAGVLTISVVAAAFLVAPAKPSPPRPAAAASLDDAAASQDGEPGP